MPQTKARDLQLLQVSGFLMYTETKYDDKITKRNRRLNFTSITRCAALHWKNNCCLRIHWKSGALSVNLDEILAELFEQCHFLKKDSF